MIKLYGIVNCDTVKKARAWLDSRKIAYQFVDFKKTPPTRAQIEGWFDALGTDAVVNRRGTTWRKLDADTQARAATASGALDVLLQNPSAIKRPVIEANGDTLIGFDEAAYAQRLKA